jgi:hypothetical protein
MWLDYSTKICMLSNQSIEYSGDEWGLELSQNERTRKLTIFISILQANKQKVNTTIFCVKVVNRIYFSQIRQNKSSISWQFMTRWERDFFLNLIQSRNHKPDNQGPLITCLGLLMDVASARVSWEWNASKTPSNNGNTWTVSVRCGSAPRVEQRRSRTPRLSRRVRKRTPSSRSSFRSTRPCCPRLEGSRLPVSCIFT